MNIAAVGFTCIDVYENLQRSYATGNGVDCLINLSQMGVAGSVVSAVGQDAYADLMRNTLAAYAIDHSHVHTLPGRTAVIKMSLNGLDRVHGERQRGVMEGYDLLPGDLEFIHQHDAIHTDLSWNVLPRLPAMRAKGARVFFDFSIKALDPRVKEILPHVEWGMFSFPEKNADALDFLHWAAQIGGGVRIGTFGEAGAVAVAGSRVYEQPVVLQPRIVNTVGAGDAFAAGFLFGISKGEPIDACLYHGAQTASHVIGMFEPYDASRLAEKEEPV